MNTEISKIWKNFYQELRIFILKKTNSKEETDDVLQDVFLKIIHNFDKVSNAKNSQQYIYGIVRNVLSDHFRNKKRTAVQANLNALNAPISESNLVDSDSNNLNTIIANCCVTPFIEQLPEKYKEALLLSEIQNLSQKELATQLNISYSGAKSRVQRGREKLKELILQCCQLETDVYGNLLNIQKNNCDCD